MLVIKNKFMLSTALSGCVLGVLTPAADAADLAKPAPMPVKALATDPIFSWTGFYIGGSIGYGWSNFGNSVTYYDPKGVLGSLPNISPAPLIGSGAALDLGGSADGFAGGGQVGYNYQVGNFLLGLEADVNFLSASKTATLAQSGTWESSTSSASYLTDILTSTFATTSAVYVPTSTLVTFNTSGTLTTTTVVEGTTYSGTLSGTFPTSTLSPSYSFVSNTTFDTTTTSVTTTGTTSITYPTPASWGSVTTGRASVDWVSTIRARAGFTADRALFYVTGGLAIGDVSQSTTTVVNIGGSSPASYVFGNTDTSTRVGYAIGGGIEYAFTNNWTMRAQYIYYNLGSDTYGSLPIGPGSGSGIFGMSKQTLDGNIANIGINYKF